MNLLGKLNTPCDFTRLFPSHSPSTHPSNLQLWTLTTSPRAILPDIEPSRRTEVIGDAAWRRCGEVFVQQAELVSHLHEGKPRVMLGADGGRPCRRQQRALYVLLD